MRKALLLPLVGVVLLGGAGAGYYVIRHRDHLRQGELALARGDLPSAQIEFRNAVRDQPGSGAAHFDLARVEAMGGDPIAAEKDYRLALTGGYDPAVVKPALAESYMAQGHLREMLADFPVPDGPPALATRIDVLRAEAYLRLKDNANAQSAIDAAQHIDPNFAEASLVAAQVALARGDTATADKQVDHAIELDQHSAGAHLFKAQMLVARGDRTGAMRDLDAAIAAQPNMIAARMARADLLLNLGQDAKATADVDAALAADPKSVTGLFLRAVIKTRARDWAGADEIFTRISQFLPRLPRGLFLAALVKSNLGQLEQAMDNAVRYVARTPNDAEGVKLLARIAIATKRPDQAVEILTKAAGNGQADAETLDLLGRAYGLSGQPARAMQSFQNASKLAPENVDILTRLASTRLGMGDVAGANADLEKSEQLSPHASNVAQAMVLAALAAGDIPKAQAALQKVREKEGDSETVANLSGLIKLAQIDLAGARATFESVLKSNPKSLPAKLNLAKVAVLQGQPAEAEKLLGDVLDIEPTNDAALTALLTHLLNTNRVGRAIEIVQKARAAAPDNALLTSTLADLDTRNGEPEKAIAVLDRAPKDQIGLPALLGARARALVTMNNLSDARDTYTRILTQNPNDLDARGHLTDVLVALKDYTGARTTVQDGLRLLPKNYAMLRALTQIESRASGFPAALELADKLEKDPANLPEARMLKGDLYIAAHQLDKAADAFAQELKAAPSTELAIRLASTQETLGHSDQAIQTLTDWIAKNPDDAAAIAAVAYDEIAAQKNDLAQAHLEALIAKRPGDAMAMNNLAWIYGLKNDPRALPLARKAYALRPVAEVADTLGWLMVRDGQSDSALPLLREASDIMHDNPAVQFHYAMGLKETGHRDEAVRVLSTALATTADFPGRADAQDLLKQLNASK